MKRSTITTGLDMCGIAALTVGALLAFGVAAALGVAGGFMLALSYSLSRRGGA